ncbi:MAG: response regulator transcription factor [Sphingobacteriales bacterium]|nr:response regulator transcription factor [Sphingobacteriales bacterium]
MEKVRVHIIEDNKVIRDNVSKFISFHEEFELGRICDSVQPFLDSLLVNPDKHTQILLLDVGLPGISGIEAIPHILEKEPDMNIVMLTTYEEEDVILKALCSGACSYISKKASLDEIVDALRIVASGGSYMSPSVAREIVNHLMGGRISKATILSERQREILERLVDGKSYQTIASELFVSVETVRSHVKKMYKVLHVNNKTEAIRQYMSGQIK